MATIIRNNAAAAISACMCNTHESLTDDTHTDYKYLHSVANHGALKSNKNERDEREYIQMYLNNCDGHFTLCFKRSPTSSCTHRDKYVRLSTYLYVCCLVQLKIDELAQTNEPNVIQNFRKNSIRNGTVAFLGHSPTISAY